MKRTLAAASAAIGLIVMQAGGAHAEPRTLTTAVQAPFHLAMSNGSVLVADGGLDVVGKIGAGGRLVTVARGPQPGEVAGVATGADGAIAYTFTAYADGSTGATVRTGSATTTVSTSSFEAANNPDRGHHYGVKNPTQCQIDAIKAIGGQPRYHGLIDSHPYDIINLGSDYVIADAAGNDLLRMKPDGSLSVLSALPVQPFTFTPDVVASLGLPDCMNNVTYKFEPVPTGLSMGADGWIYVSMLPGGPEDPSFGARGSVYKVNPATGQALRVATGFSGATDVSVGAGGNVYVAELFAGQVTRIAPNGTRSVVTSLPGVVSVEYGSGHLYAGTMAPTDDAGNPIPGGHGSVVRIW